MRKIVYLLLAAGLGISVWGGICIYLRRRQSSVREQQARQEVMDSAMQKTATRPPPAEFEPGDIVLVQHPATKKWEFKEKNTDAVSPSKRNTVTPTPSKGKRLFDASSLFLTERKQQLAGQRKVSTL